MGSQGLKTRCLPVSQLYLGSCPKFTHFSESFLCVFLFDGHVFLGCASAWLSLPNAHLLNGLHEVILQLNTVSWSNNQPATEVRAECPLPEMSDFSNGSPIQKEQCDSSWTSSSTHTHTHKCTSCCEPRAHSGSCWH